MLKSSESPLGEDKAVVDTAKCICDNKSSKVAKLPRKENANAKNRWRLLARAILSSSNREMKTKERSVISNLSRDFSGFDLVEVEQLKKDDTQTFVIKIVVGGSNKYECSVHIEQLWTMKDLIGFNNTGNCQFWASEAALTYFVMDNLRMFDNSWVLELGGGMFCLAGLMLAKFSDAFAVHLSDGNQSSVNNVRKSLMLNEANCFVKTSGGLLENQQFRLG